MRHNPTNCEVCSAIQNNPNLSNVAIARLAGTTEASVRRHKVPVSDVLGTKDEFFTDIPEAIITSRGRSIRTPDGSWQKVTYRPQDLAMYESRTYDDLERALANYTPEPAPPEDPAQPYGATEVLCLADFQLGKVASNGGTQETVDRVLHAVDRFCDKVRRTHPIEILLFDLGDSLEGFDNVSSQRGTNDLDLTLQLRTVRRLFLEIIMRLAPLTPKLVFVSIPSNHCQVRVGGGNKDLASTPNNDWGIEVSHQLEDVLADRHEYRHVSLIRTGGHDEAITYTTHDGTVIGAVHGHQANKQEQVGNWWRGQSHGRRNNLHNADLLLFGHFHNLSVAQSGDARWAIGASSADGGSDWFTNKTGESSIAGMTAFSVSDGMWRDLRIC